MLSSQESFFLMKLRRTNAVNAQFLALVAQLDAELAIRDGDDHPFYDQFNKLDSIKHVIVAYDESDTPVGCGAIKAFGPKVMEIKRMYVPLSERRKGIAAKILTELETWAKELGKTHCILETGFKQPEAIALYKCSGYRVIENYGPYAGVETSVCFEKTLTN